MFSVLNIVVGDGDRRLCLAALRRPATGTGATDRPFVHRRPGILAAAYTKMRWRSVARVVHITRIVSCGPTSVVTGEALRVCTPAGESAARARRRSAAPPRTRRAPAALRPQAAAGPRAPPGAAPSTRRRGAGWPRPRRPPGSPSRADPRSSTAISASRRHRQGRK